MITLCFILTFFVRLISLSISLKNEKVLIQEGAVQHGAAHSTLLAAAHIIYYFCAWSESMARQATFDVLSALGMTLIVFALAMLFYVIRALGKIWTLKIYIHPQHTINRSWLFQHVRHPNYFLNIVPELIGVGLLCHAWTTMMVGLPIYAVLLFIRLQQEEKAMKNVW